MFKFLDKVEVSGEVNYKVLDTDDNTVDTVSEKVLVDSVLSKGITIEGLSLIDGKVQVDVKDTSDEIVSKESKANDKAKSDKTKKSSKAKSTSKKNVKKSKDERIVLKVFSANDTYTYFCCDGFELHLDHNASVEDVSKALKKAQDTKYKFVNSEGVEIDLASGVLNNLDGLGINVYPAFAPELTCNGTGRIDLDM